MDIESAIKIMAGIEKSSLEPLKDELVRAAVAYARIRTDWRLMDLEERKGRDAARTAAHEALIDACNILSRNMAKAGEDISWRSLLGEDRREIGDFACFAHCLIGLRGR